MFRITFVLLLLFAFGFENEVPESDCTDYYTPSIERRVVASELTEHLEMVLGPEDFANRYNGTANQYGEPIDAPRTALLDRRRCAITDLVGPDCLRTPMDTLRVLQFVEAAARGPMLPALGPQWESLLLLSGSYRDAATSFDTLVLRPAGSETGSYRWIIDRIDFAAPVPTPDLPQDGCVEPIFDSTVIFRPTAPYTNLLQVRQWLRRGDPLGPHIMRNEPTVDALHWLLARACAAPEFAGTAMRVRLTDGLAFELDEQWRISRLLDSCRPY